jgi:hypothetical protein
MVLSKMARNAPKLFRPIEGIESMIIRCPGCGREGNVPDRIGLSYHKLRCRPCGTRFSVGPGPPPRSARHSKTSLSVRDSALESLDGASAQANGFSAGSDDDLPALSSRLAGDSQYEMGAIFGDGIDDSQVELPAFSPGQADEVTDPVPPFETELSEFLLTAPWYYRFIESWGRLHFYIALGFTASSLSLLGFLLLRALVAGHLVSSSTTALIIGCIGTIAFLLLSLSATALILLLVDLARNVRLLIEHRDRNLSMPADAANQSRSRLSHPVG